MMSFHDTKIGNDWKRASSEISHRIPYHCRRITLSHIFFTTISIAISLTYDSRLTKNISFRHATKFFVNRHPSVAFILSSFVFIYCDLIKSLFAWEFFFRLNNLSNQAYEYQYAEYVSLQMRSACSFRSLHFKEIREWCQSAKIIPTHYSY